MKKILRCFSLLILSMVTFIGCSGSGKNSMSGISLRSTNGISFIIDEDNFPITMGNNAGKEDAFDDLKNGDKIEITYDSINETYPWETNVYSYKLIERGSIDNIPKEVLDKLEEMGYSFDF